MASPRAQQAQRIARAARKAWPYVIMAYERWQALPPEKRERYLRQAREAVSRARPPRGSGGGSTGRFRRPR